LGQEEIDEVVDCLRNNWLTTGPKVEIFEKDFAAFVGAKHAVAVNSCTAALTVALAALGVGPGDEVIVPTLTFCATANVVEHRGARPVVVDIADDLQIDTKSIKKSISLNTRAIIPVHYGGLACDLNPILELARHNNLCVIEDAAHAVGADYDGRKIGSHDSLTAFSFYPSKNITTGEGGMLTTNDDRLASKIRLLSRSGIHRPTGIDSCGAWNYEVLEAGYKSNMMDLQAAIGIHQLRRLPGFIYRRRQIAERYKNAFADLPELSLPTDLSDRQHTYYLYTVRLVPGITRLDRRSFMAQLNQAGIQTSVHFVPLHRHPFYRSKYGYSAEQFPIAEKVCDQIVSLPLYPSLSDHDLAYVITRVREVVIKAREGAGVRSL
jgi:dTDP-4-amino-4,6-dideoxygalactose transaminase